jgi:hypothetical protein
MQTGPFAFWIVDSVGGALAMMRCRRVKRSMSSSVGDVTNTDTTPSVVNFSAVVCKVAY